MRVLVIGAGGYVGSRLIPALLEDGHQVVAGARDLHKLDAFWWGDAVDRVELDATGDDSVRAAIAEDPALEAVVYLVHGMGGEDFREVDRAAARRVRAAVDASEVKAVVYLSGIIPDIPREELSEHLASRLEVEEELSAARCRFVGLRAAVVLGAASTSFELMTQLAHRLPVTVFPDWMDHLVEPVAVVDAVAAIRAAVATESAHGVYDIGGGEVIAYPQLVQKVLELTDQERPGFSVPVMPQSLVTAVGSWLSDIPAPTVTALMESLREDMVARDERWLSELLPDGHAARVTIDEALRRSLAAPDVSRSPRERDPLAVMPGDPSWATNGEGQERVLEFKQD